MNNALRVLQDKYLRESSAGQHPRGLTGSVKDFVLAEMAAARQREDWEGQEAVVEFTRLLRDPMAKSEALNELLVMPNHEVHQQIAMEIQNLRDPSSVPFIRQVLETRFEFLQYTCSEQSVIAKWFSHALAEINSPESIDLIREFAHSNDQGIAAEMTYRLSQIGNRRR
jgi:hypothetical protein